MFGSVNTAIFQAARAAKKSVFTSIMDNRVKPFKHLAYEQLMKRDLGTWTHHASAQDTVILDQVTSNPAESTMHMVGAPCEYSVTVLRLLMCQPMPEVLW